MWLLAAKGTSGRLLAASWPFDGVSGRAAADFVLGTLLFYRIAQVGALTRKIWVTSSCLCKKAEGVARQLLHGLQVEPVPVLHGLQVQPAPVLLGLQVQPVPVLLGLQVQPVPVLLGLQVRPASG
jgi:hypothetical protein